MRHTLTVAVAATLVLATSATAFAGNIEPGDHVEMAAVLMAPITPTQAVKVEDNGGGRAYGYGIKANRRGHWYEADVLHGNAKLLLRIDATTGKLPGGSPARRRR